MRASSTAQPETLDHLQNGACRFFHEKRQVRAGGGEGVGTQGANGCAHLLRTALVLYAGRDIVWAASRWGSGGVVEDDGCCSCWQL